jgi:hypothetical protein
MALGMKANARPGDGAAGVIPPVAPRQPVTSDGPRSTADLVKGIAEDASNLVRQQFLLARQEMTEGAVVAGKAGAVLAAAGVVALYALGFLLTTIAWAIVDLGWPRWAGFGIVTLVLLIVAAVLGVVGRNRLAKARLSPDRAQAELRHATSDLVEGARTGADNVRAEAVATAEAVKVGAVTLPERARSAATGAAGGARGAAGDAATATGGLLRRLRSRFAGRDGGAPPIA